MERKRVFLVRHAQSVENRKGKQLTGALRALGQGKMPAKEDVSGGVSLLWEPSWTNTPLTEEGRAQVARLTERLQADDFLDTHDVTTLLHSPLHRAKDTMQAVLDADRESRLLRIECPIMEEKRIWEWMPGQVALLDARIAEFEKMVASTEGNVICVGHSQFFKRMLNMDFKFNNCDVWEVEVSTEKGEYQWHTPKLIIKVA